MQLSNALTQHTFLVLHFMPDCSVILGWAASQLSNSQNQSDSEL